MATKVSDLGIYSLAGVGSGEGQEKVKADSRHFFSGMSRKGLEKFKIFGVLYHLN